MSLLLILPMINLSYFIYHFGFKRHLKFKSALNILNTLQKAKQSNKRAGLCGWIDDVDYEREKKVYGLKFTKITKDGNPITEITL